MDVGKNSIPHVDPFRQRLQSVASDVTNENLAAMKFLCENFIPKGRLERLLRPLELFSVLIEQDLIGDNRSDFLISIFNAIGRHDLSKRILDKEGSTARGRSNAAVHNEVNRDVRTITIGDEVDRNAQTVTIEDKVNRDDNTQDLESLSTKIVFAYPTTSSDLLQGLPETALRRRVTERVLFGRGKGIEERGVFLNDETASRRHIELEAIADGRNSQIEFFLHVYGHPIQVNGKSIKSGQRIKLKNNYDLKMGQLQFKVHIIPGVNLDTYQLEFARLSDLQSVNGQGTAFPVNYYPFAQVPGYIPLPNLTLNQGPQLFHPQVHRLDLPGDASVSFPYPDIRTLLYMCLLQAQRQPVLPQSRFNGTSTFLNRGLYPQSSDLIKLVSAQQEDQAFYVKTASGKRKVFQDQKRKPSGQAEDEQSEEVRLRSLTIS